jgi:hypothetical protein
MAFKHARNRHRKVFLPPTVPRPQLADLPWRQAAPAPELEQALAEMRRLMFKQMEDQLARHNPLVKLMEEMERLKALGTAPPKTPPTKPRRYLLLLPSRRPG